MVYKKIGNKIPSLSTLLLAGIAITGGKCPGSKENKAPAAAVKDNQPLQPGHKVSDSGADKVDDGQYLKAVKNMYASLFRELGLDRLSKASDMKVLEKPTVQHKELKALVKDAFAWYANAGNITFLPSEMQKSFEAFKMDKFKEFQSGWSVTRGTPHKSAYYDALASLVNPFRHLADAYEGSQDWLKHHNTLTCAECP